MVVNPARSQGFRNGVSRIEASALGVQPRALQRRAAGGSVANMGGSARHGQGHVGNRSPLTALALEVNDLVRGSQQCSVASPQLCALVEVPAGESVGVGGS
jgi:hypothetical protein